MVFEPTDVNDLKKAKLLLENPGVAAKLTRFLGVPIEKGFKLLPANWSGKIGELTQTALSRAVETAVFTMNAQGEKASNLWHKMAVATTGGIGGFFGLAALAMELPVSTTLMLRSIADIARSEGESIHGMESKMACIEVFALGGPTPGDDGAETGYFAVRAALAQAITRAVDHVAGVGLAQKGSPGLVRLILIVAERFSVQVTEKAAAQAIPALGAAGGAIINTVFMDHFQEMARGHFIVRRLERKYGKALVEETYQGL